jgi:N-acetyl-D-muramate 6-phosphate phosphatase
MIRALIWDFDGTLVDTRERNFSAARRIYARMSGRDPGRVAAFASLEAYEAAHRRTANWREFYRQGLGMAPEEIDEAGRLWSEHQLADSTPLPLLPGVAEALAALADFRHGIVSQNSRAQIERTLDGADLRHRFALIVGYEEVPLGRQKPAPDGLLRCLEALTGLQPGVAFFIGDHETDMVTAANANRVLEERGLVLRVRTIAARFLPGMVADEWSVRADFAAARPAEVAAIVERCGEG